MLNQMATRDDMLWYRINIGMNELTRSTILMEMKVQFCLVKRDQTAFEYYMVLLMRLYSMQMNTR